MKGDYVRIQPSMPGSAPVEITASKQGRRVVRSNRTSAKVLWLDVKEVTRTGKPTGTSISVRQDAILSIVEVRNEP